MARVLLEAGALICLAHLMVSLLIAPKVLGVGIEVILLGIGICQLEINLLHRGPEVC